jgi:1,4-dihydroxy-2-naphthoate octaprenyltransferase
VDAPRPKSMLARWIKAARPLAHGNIAPPILFGVAMGCGVTGVLDRTGLVLALAFGVFDHLAIVFFNDLSDEAADRLNENPSLVAGGSRVLVDGDLSRRQLFIAGVASVIGLLLLSGGAALIAPAMLGLLLAALLLLWLYSGSPVRLSHRGFGSLLQGLGVGAVLPLVGFVLQAPGALPEPAFLLPSVLLGIAGNLLTAIPDAEADHAAGKRTLASQRGVRIAAWAAVLVSTVASALGASLFSANSTEAQVLTVVPLLFLLPALLLLNRIEGDRGIRLRFVLLSSAAGTSALLCWTVVQLS